jgi:hypothetical protein
VSLNQVAWRFFLKTFFQIAPFKGENPLGSEENLVTAHGKSPAWPSVFDHIASVIVDANHSLCVSGDTLRENQAVLD